MIEQYAMYLRKSREDREAEAHGDGETLARHRNRLFEIAKYYKLNITKVFEEVVSGESIAARPQMQALLIEVEKGIYTGVLVVEVERLARGNSIDQGLISQTFKYSNTKIITPTKTYDPTNEFDEEYFEFGLFMSRREYNTIRRRLTAGRVASAKEGNFTGSTAPYGYKKIKNEKDKGFTLEPVPNQAEIIKVIYDLYSNGRTLSDGSKERIGCQKIAHYLNELGIKPARGEHWADTSIRDILINPVYNGKIKWNWRPEVKNMVNGNVTVSRPRNPEPILVEGKHQAIIDDETFNNVQYLVAQNKPRPSKNKVPMNNPLSGLIKCGKCGKTMQRRPYRNGTPDFLICPSSKCTTVSAFLHLVENNLLIALEQWANHYELTYTNLAEEKSRNAQLNSISSVLSEMEKEEGKIKKQLSRIYELLEQEIYSTTEFLERSKQNADKLKALSTDKKRIEEELEKEKALTERMTLVIPKVRNLIDVYWTLPDAKAKNDMLKTVLEKVIYTREGEGGRWTGELDTFILDIFPKASNN